MAANNVKTVLTRSVLKSLMTLCENGMTHAEAGEVVGLSRSYVGNTLMIASMVKEHDWEGLYQYRRKFEGVMRVACEYYAVPFELIERMGKPEPGPAAPAPAPVEPEPAAPAAPADTNTALYLTKLLENQAHIIELFETFMDVVLPKYAKDLTGAIDVNCDVINKELITQSGYLDNIRGNVKRNK